MLQTRRDPTEELAAELEMTRVTEVQKWPEPISLHTCRARTATSSAT
jgi:hypothetical protein